MCPVFNMISQYYNKYNEKPSKSRAALGGPAYSTEILDR